MDTWVLQQINDRDHLEQLAPRLRRAVADTDAVGISLRFPWDTLERDPTLLDRGRELTDRFSVRFMAGQHTPAGALGAASYSITTRQGRRLVPCPFIYDGQTNAGFVEAWTRFAASLSGWCHDNDVDLLHLSWWAQEWAELNHGIEVRTQPGYSEHAWLEAHRALVNRGAALAGDHLTVELPLSGYGPITRVAPDLAQAMIDTGAPWVIQGNGWTAGREFGQNRDDVEADLARLWDLPLRRAVQAIQPGPQPWEPMFTRAAEIGCGYVEVYLASFEGDGADILADQIARHATPPAPDPDPADQPLTRRQLAAELRRFADLLDPADG